MKHMLCTLESLLQMTGIMNRWNLSEWRIGFNEFPPFSITCLHPVTKETLLYGIGASYLSNITTALNMTYRLKAGPFGQHNEGVKWSGIFGMLQRHEVHSVSHIIKPQAHMMDFAWISYPVAWLTTSIISGFVEPYTINPFSIIYIFDTAIWLLIGLLIIIVPVIIIGTTTDPKKDLKYWDVVLHLFALMVNMDDSKLTRSGSNVKFNRWVYGVYIFAAFLFNRNFSELLKAMLTIQSPTYRLDYPEQIISKPNFPFAVGIGSPQLWTLELSQDFRAKALLKQAYRTKAMVPPQGWKNMTFFRDLVNRRKAHMYFCDTVEIYYSSAIDRKSDQGYLYCSKYTFGTEYFIFVLSKKLVNENLFDAFNKRLMWMKESGVKIMHDFELVRPGRNIFWNTAQHAVSRNVKAMTLTDLQIAFYILIVLLLFATLAFIGENITYRYQVKFGVINEF